MIISAIGQMADFADGLERLDSGRGAVAIDPASTRSATWTSISPAATSCGRIC